MVMIQKRSFFQAFDKNGLIDPNVAKAGGLQSPRRRDFHFVTTRRAPKLIKSDVNSRFAGGVKGEVVVGYRPPSAEQHRIWSPPAFPACWVVAESDLSGRSRRRSLKPKRVGS